MEIVREAERSWTVLDRTAADGVDDEHARAVCVAWCWYKILIGRVEVTRPEELARLARDREDFAEMLVHGERVFSYEDELAYIIESTGVEDAVVREVLVHLRVLEREMGMLNDAGFTCFFAWTWGQGHTAECLN